MSVSIVNSSDNREGRDVLSDKPIWSRYRTSKDSPEDCGHKHQMVVHKSDREMCVTSWCRVCGQLSKKHYDFDPQLMDRWNPKGDVGL